MQTVQLISLGVVVIGRNEGERLQRCLRSVSSQTSSIVYVDSGSTDGSVQAAAQLGASVVELDLSKPFTAARARNVGYLHLKKLHPTVTFIQFVDGDCEIVDGWLDAGLSKIEAGERTAVVCGRRRELYPDTSVYNRLCDIEWSSPPGLAKSCGGDALIRLSALEEVGGYDPTLIAGEEPDLCFRLRQKGWEIWRLDEEMTRHDACMTQFSQWWKRNVRAGHARAEALWRHGPAADPASFRSVLSNLFWATPVTWPAWPVLWWRIYSRGKDFDYASFLLLGKLPQSQGQLRFWWSTLTSQTITLIEYK